MNGMKNYILIVEDDNDINQMIKELLQQNGYDTLQAFSGTEALLYMEREVPVAMILDLMLPGMSGEDVLVTVKKEHPEVAVIISSAKEDTKTRIELLRSGADDYIVKPFDVEELLARLEAVLRRSVQYDDIRQKKGSSEGEICYKDIVLMLAEFRATVGGQELRLTKREYLILELLMKNPGKVFTKNNIFESVWNEEFVGEDNAVNVHISNLRQKLAKINPEEMYIETVWGIGFKLKS